MSYEPRLRRSTADKITQFLQATYPSRTTYLAAVDEVRAALDRLAVSPKQATSPPGLFEKRPIFRFELCADGVPRVVQVCFCFDPEDSTETQIWITDFDPDPDLSPP